MTPKSRLRLLADIGADRYASRDELQWPATLNASFIDDAWRVYVDHFGGFTGAHLDPSFERFRRPEACCGTITLTHGATVAVVEASDSLAAHADALRRVRDRLIVVTAPSGASALAQFGLAPDLIVVEHPPTPTAPISGTVGGERAFPTNVWIASDLRTPAAQFAGAAADRVFVPHEWPGWGCWPATAVALAMSSGARRVWLLGTELGTPAGIAPEHAPTAALLTLLARTSVAECLHAGHAIVKGWRQADAAAIAPATPAMPLGVDSWAIGSRYFVDEAERWRDRSKTLVARARQALALARAVRDGADPEYAHVAAQMILAWGRDAALRTGLQQMLGLTVLPRLWRLGLDRTPADQTWWPVLVGLDEMVTQADRLDLVLSSRAVRAVA